MSRNWGRRVKKVPGIQGFGGTGPGKCPIQAQNMPEFIKFRPSGPESTRISGLRGGHQAKKVPNSGIRHFSLPLYQPYISSTCPQSWVLFRPGGPESLEFGTFWALFRPGVCMEGPKTRGKIGGNSSSFKKSGIFLATCVERSRRFPNIDLAAKK